MNIVDEISYILKSGDKTVPIIDLYQKAKKKRKLLSMGHKNVKNAE